jgi:hypothetical protein
MRDNGIGFPAEPAICVHQPGKIGSSVGCASSQSTLPVHQNYSKMGPHDYCRCRKRLIALGRNQNA